MPDSPFSISVIGDVKVHDGGQVRPRLSPASRQFLATLVAAGPAGIHGTDLAHSRGNTAGRSADQAVRMAAARLRPSLPGPMLPRAGDGVYRLAAASRVVDVWHLETLVSGGLAGRDETDVDDVQVLRHLLRPVVPYADIPASGLIEQSGHRVRRLQRQLLVQLAAARPEAMRGEFLEFAIEHCDLDPLNEQLLTVTASSVSRSGDRRLALRLIRSTRAALADVGLEPSGTVVALEADLLDGLVSTIDVPGDAWRGRATTVAMPAQLLARLGDAYVGERRELTALCERIDQPDTGMSTVLLSGSSGAGKTRLCAEAGAHAAARGWAVLLVMPSLAGTDAPMAPLVASMPELGASFARIALRGADADSVRLAMWNQAKDALERLTADRDVLMIVDDAQWLDDATSEFLGHLVSTSIAGRLLIVVNGRDDVDRSDRWEALRARIESLGAITTHVTPLDRAAVTAFVDDRRPGMNAALLNAVTQEIFERSAGLPGVAGPLLAALPEGSAVLPATPRPAPHQPLAPAIAGLSANARRVGIGAAVLSPRFRFNQLQAVVSAPPADLLDGLDELIDRGLIVDATVTEYEIVHALVETALLGAASSAELALTHSWAAEHHWDDVHRRAHHLWQARPFVEIDEAVSALRESAWIHLRDGSYREAIRRFEAIRELQPDALTAQDLGKFARALDVSGATDRAREVRHDGFQRAAAVSDWLTALDIASSGLPEAEPIDGDASVAAQLMLIEPSSFGRLDAWRHAVTTARQLAIVGRGSESLAFAARAADLARSSAEIVAAALASRFAMSVVATPRECLEVMAAVSRHLDEIDDLLLGDYYLNLALDHHQAGDLEASLDTLDLLEKVDGRSAVKIWQGQLMRAMHHTDAGEGELADAMRLEAHTFAAQAGLVGADDALLAAMFVDQWLAGAAGIFLGEIDGGTMDPSRALLTKAGAAAVLFDVGEQHRAGVLAIEVAKEALAAPTPIGMPALLVVAQALSAADAPAALIDTTRARLADRGDSMVVLGGGAANLGPVQRYLAYLATSDAERDRSLAAAAALAERSGSVLWQRLCPPP